MSFRMFKLHGRWSIQLYVCVDESHEVKALITMLHSWTTQDERWDSLKCENIEQMAEPAIYGWSFLCHVSVVALWKTLIMESCVSITNTSSVLLSIFSLSYLLLQCLIVSDCRLCVCVNCYDLSLNIFLLLYFKTYKRLSHTSSDNLQDVIIIKCYFHAYLPQRSNQRHGINFLIDLLFFFQFFFLFCVSLWKLNHEYFFSYFMYEYALFFLKF